MTWSTVLLTPARTSLRAGGCAVGALVLSAGAAFAAEGAKAGASDVIFLAQLIALMLVGRLLGEVMNRIGQPSVMGMLLGGIVLGPTVLGVIWPALQHAIFPSAPEQKAMLDGIAQFGILLLLLLTGMETDLKLVRTVGKAALSISLTGVAVPFVCGFALGQFIPASLLPHQDQRLLTSLFLGTPLSISSINIVAALLRSQPRTDHRGLGDLRGFDRLDHHRHHLRPGGGGLDRGHERDQERAGNRGVPWREPHDRTADGVLRDSLGERQFPERLSRD